MVEEYRSGRIDEAAAIDRVERQGFGDVIPRFHTVNRHPIGMAFYEDTGRSLVLTDDLLRLFAEPDSGALGPEVLGRWDLVEAAFDMRLPAEVLATDGEQIYRVRAERRTPITPARPILQGYQNGLCFYCGMPLGAAVHVDHVIPRVVVRHDHIWNLVLADAGCNASKSAFLPAMEDVEALHRRNKYYIASNHPIKKHLIRQTGETPAKRAAFILGQYEAARAQVFHVWSGPASGRRRVDPLRPLALVR